MLNKIGDERKNLLDCKKKTLEIKEKTYIVEKEVGRGASSICYLAESDGIKWIIKEFYPIQSAKREDTTFRVISDGNIDDFSKQQRLFNNALEQQGYIQKDNLNFFMEYSQDRSDDSYVIVNARDGQTLKSWVKSELCKIDEFDKGASLNYVMKCLHYLKAIANHLDIWYQSKGRIHFDIKPDNIYLLNNDGEIIVRIIDFDSMQTFVNLKCSLETKKDEMPYITEQYYGDEFRLAFRKKLEDNLNDSTWKQIDVYALGATLLYMLTGEEYVSQNTFNSDFKFFKHEEGLEKKINVVRQVLCQFISKCMAPFPNRYSDSKTVKFVIENIEGILKNKKWFDGFSEYRNDLVPSIVCEGVEFKGDKFQSPLEQVYDRYLENNDNKLQLVAESGMGKSYALRRLFINCALSNQCKKRFYYYPLRNCTAYSYAKNLLTNIISEYTYGSSEEPAVYFLDAYDEMDLANNKDLEFAANKVLTDINFAGIITSRYEIEALETPVLKCGNFKIKSNEMLNTIAKNSPWLSDGNALFFSPMMVVMAESVGKLDGYLVVKGAGPFVKKKIHESMIGRIVNDTVQINYAGELIWNYIHISILSQFINANDKLEAAINTLKNIKADNLDLLGNQTFFEKLTSKKIIGTNMYYNTFLEAMNCADEFDLYSLFSESRIWVDGVILPIAFDQMFEMFGCRYQQLESEGIRYRTLSDEDIDTYRSAVSSKYMELPYKKISISEYQEKHIDIFFKAISLIYELNSIDKKAKEKTIKDTVKLIMQSDLQLASVDKLSNLEKTIITLSGYKKQKTISFNKALFEKLLSRTSVTIQSHLLYIIFSWENIRFSNIQIKHIGMTMPDTSFSFCEFENCTIHIVVGEYENCIFRNLDASSILPEYIYDRNTVDDINYGYHINGNTLSLDKRRLYGLNNIEKLPEQYLKDVNVVYAYDFNYLDKKEYRIPQTVKKVYFVLFGKKNEVNTKIIIEGNTRIEHDQIDVIPYLDTSKSKLHHLESGVLYEKTDYGYLLNEISKGVNEIRFLPNMLYSFQGIIDNSQVGFDSKVKRVIMPDKCLDPGKLFKQEDALKSLAEHIFLDHLNISEIENLPKNYSFVCGCVVSIEEKEDNKEISVEYKLDDGNKLIYLPSYKYVHNALTEVIPYRKLKVVILADDINDIPKSVLHGLRKYIVDDLTELTDKEKLEVERQKKEWDNFFSAIQK